jgi:metallo-beta-lactamase family protein
MKIQFLGAAGTVTGSRFLVTHGEIKVLVDCGLFQGFKNLRLKNWDKFPLDVKELDAVVITHGHLDHSGYIPLLVKNGFRGSIYATPPTVELCKILLPDSGYLQEEEAKFANKRGYSKHNPAKPLYTVEDAEDSLNYFKALPWRQPTQIAKKGANHVDLSFYPAGHLLGAASVLLKTDSGSIAFSGDLGRAVDPMVRPPDFDLGADTLVVESTYGNRHHLQVDTEEELKNVILRTHKRGGILLIPSFAVGRAQLILYYIYRLKKSGQIPTELPVYLNSPMAAEANRAFAEHFAELQISHSDLNAIWKGVQIIKSADESKALNEQTKPAIVIAASGMATGGRVLHHLKSVAPHPQNTILFVGFQAGGTRGDLIVRGAKEIKIHGEYWPIKAEVVNMETLSAHADAEELLAWIGNLKHRPERVFVVHGEPEAADALRHSIEEKLKIPASVPEYLQKIELT